MRTYRAPTALYRIASPASIPSLAGPTLGVAILPAKLWRLVSAMLLLHSFSSRHTFCSARSLRSLTYTWSDFGYAARRHSARDARASARRHATPKRKNARQRSDKKEESSSHARTYGTRGGIAVARGEGRGCAQDSRPRAERCSSC